MKALAKSAGDRYATAREFQLAIEDWLLSERLPASQAHLADWYSESTNKMLSDGTHPWPYACTIYARVIANTLRTA